MAQFTVGTTSVQIAAGAGKHTITNGAAVVALGTTSAVTTSTGLLVPANATLNLELGGVTGGSIFAICASSSVVSTLSLL